MKAALLKEWGKPLSVEIVPDPVIGTGEVIVDMVATNLPAYASEGYCQSKCTAVCQAG